MYFLIGVIILIIFAIFVYFFIKHKIKGVLRNVGLDGMNIKDIVEEARLQDEDNVKSLSNMDSVYLDQIKKDYKDININELKREAEKNILDLFNAVENNDTSNLNGKVKSIADKMISDYGGSVKFNNFKFHNTVISNYKKEKGIATIYFGSSFEYYLVADGVDKKIQDRAKTEFIYVYDISKVDKNVNNIGIRCPNCGSPLVNLSDKKCSYCGGTVLEIICRIFTCNDIVRY